MRNAREVKSIGIILLMVVLAHGMNVLNDGVYTDGWMIHHYVRDLDFAKIRQIFIDIGQPAWPVYLYWALAQLGDIVTVSRIATFCAIAVTSVAIYYCVRQLSVFSEREVVICTIVASVYSAYQMELNMIMTYATFSVMFFYIGIFLYQKTLERKSLIVVWLLQLTSIALVLVSFNLNSLLVYYYGILPIIHYFGGLFHLREFKRMVNLRHAIMYLVPLVYWFVKVQWYPNIDYFNAYNTFVVDPATWGIGLFKFLMNAINAQFSSGMNNLLLYPLIMVGAFFLAKKLQSVDDSSPTNDRAVMPSTIIAAGGWLFMFSVGAYLLVGKSPSVSGWDSRLSILVSLSVGVVLIGMMRYVLNSVTRDEVGRRIVMFLIAALMFGFVMTYWRTTIAWELNWIRDRAFMEQLKDHDEWRDKSIYVIKDDSSVPHAVYYHGVAYAGLLKNVWGGETRIGLDANTCRNVDFREYIASLDKARKSVPWLQMSEIDPQGERIDLRIRRHGELQSHTVFAMYFLYKYFKPEQLAGFLSSLYSVERIPPNELCKS